jgi:hypothetical protein
MLFGKQQTRDTLLKKQNNEQTNKNNNNKKYQINKKTNPNNIVSIE